VAFARRLVERVGVAGVPGSSFFSQAALGRGFIRFTFCKREATLDAAAERLSDVRGKLA
jgi:aminotransferase